MTPSASPTRTLSTAEDRREAVLQAAGPIMAARGLLATPTTEVAKAAGISHAYLFRLFPTKVDLAVAVATRCHERIHDAFAAAAAEAKRRGEDPLHAMGQAYTELIADQDLLVGQLHAHAASAGVPEIRAANQACWARLFDLVERETGATEEQIGSFFATGMLCNVMAAIGAKDVHERWAQVLTGYPEADDPA